MPPGHSPAFLQLLFDIDSDGLILEIIVLGPIYADVFIFYEEFHHSSKPFIQVEVVAFVCPYFPRVDGQ